MKSKIVGIMVIVALLVAMLGVAVNAASMSVAPESKVGDTVTVTVNVGAVRNFDIILKYDSKAYQYVSASADGFLGNPNGSTAGEVVYSGITSNNVSSDVNVTFTFKAIATSDTSNFEVTNFRAGTGNKEVKSLDNSKITTKVVKEEVKPEENTTPAENTTTENTSKDNNTKPATENKTTNNGSRTDATTKNTGKTETPTTTGKKVLPQTGAPVYAYVLGIVAIAGVVTLVAKKNNK